MGYFKQRYFGARYFSSRYSGGGSGAVAAVVDYFIRMVRRRR